MTVRVAAVVLNWCGYESTVECVESVLASDGAEPIVLIVDNASPDGSGARLRGRFPELEVIEAGANLGYAGGNNLGIDRARALEAEYILILNNDVTIAPDCVRFMVETLEQNPRAALVGAKIVHADDGTIGAVGGEIRWEVAEPRQVGHLEPDRGQYVGVREVDFAPGTAVLARTVAIEQVGAIPEDYFLYFEDVDWSLRFRRAGWSILVDPRARVVHKESSSTGRHSPLKGYYYVRNNLIFLERHVPAERVARTRWRLRAKFGRMLAREVLGGRLGVARAMVRGYLDHRAGIRGISPHPLQ